jgi:hypothetical protein
MAKDIPGEWGDALRFALGADVSPGTSTPLWAAARRSRIQPRLSGDPTLRKDRGKPNCFRLSDYFPSQALADISLPDQFACFGQELRFGEWVPALWPQNPEPVFAVSSLSNCMEIGPGVCRVASGLTFILEPDVPVSPLASLMLCRGLNAEDKATGQATVDALMTVIDDGRLDGETLGAAMNAFLASGSVIARRWQTRLAEVGHSSPLATLVMKRTLERALWPLEPHADVRDIYIWLEALLAFCVTTSLPVHDDQARIGITVYGKGGKAQKAAQALLSFHENTTDDSPMIATFNRALEKRVEQSCP